MSDRIIIDGIPAYDGEYDLGDAPFNNREYHTIKRLTGLRAFEIDEAFGAGDTDLALALAAIALARNGKQVDEDLLWDAEGGAIRFMPEEVDARPPELPASEPGVNGNSSGDSSAASSESQASAPSPTGEAVLSEGYAHPI